jgi:SRSO17 transposase
MVMEEIRAAPDTIARWSEALDALSQRIASRFARVAVRERARRDCVGLLGTLERKHGWQLAAAIGACGANGVQRLLNAATGDAAAVRAELRAYVIDHLGDEASGILIVDATGLLKRGAKSCGVCRQDTGTAGDTVDCPVGVFLADASAQGTAVIDRSLSLPRQWAKDPDRRTEAGIPAGARVASKITLAERTR